jgi:hypothetical protein
MPIDPDAPRPALSASTVTAGRAILTGWLLCGLLDIATHCSDAPGHRCTYEFVDTDGRALATAPFAVVAGMTPRHHTSPFERSRWRGGRYAWDTPRAMNALGGIRPNQTPEIWSGVRFVPPNRVSSCAEL